jgi:hypothetical protein
MKKIHRLKYLDTSLKWWHTVNVLHETKIGTMRGLGSPVLAGHRTCNADLAGSIPVPSSKRFKDARGIAHSSVTGRVAFMAEQPDQPSL